MFKNDGFTTIPGPVRYTLMQSYLHETRFQSVRTLGMRTFIYYEAVQNTIDLHGLYCANS